ncbi:GNAT family N-acetyltransferase [Jatrophihabitans sp. YIM 134969]
MFSMRADDVVSLGLVERRHVAVLDTLWQDNADRLREWEPWAAEDGALDDPSGWVRYCLDRFAQGSAVFAFILRDDEPVGTVGLWLESDRTRASIGYFVDAKHEGDGLVTRAVRRMVEYALEERGVEWIEVGVAASHSRSRAVPERLGFELAGVEAGGLEFPDRKVDRALYVLTA